MLGSDRQGSECKSETFLLIFFRFFGSFQAAPPEEGLLPGYKNLRMFFIFPALFRVASKAFREHYPRHVFRVHVRRCAAAMVAANHNTKVLTFYCRLLTIRPVRDNKKVNALFLFKIPRNL